MMFPLNCSKPVAVVLVTLLLVVGAVACTWIYNGGTLRFISNFNFELKSKPDIVIQVPQKHGTLL